MQIDFKVYPFLFILLLFFVLFPGCLNGNVSSKAQPVLVTVTVIPPTEYPEPGITHIGQTPTLSYSYGTAKCPIPPLIFNNSQEFTTLHVGLHTTLPGEHSSSAALSIPYGSIIYHSSGAITRIFDPSGSQILTVNDSESSVLTNTGYDAATTLFDIPTNLTVIGTGDVQYYINQGDKVNPCVQVIIYSGWHNPFFPGNLGSKLGK